MIEDVAEVEAVVRFCNAALLSDEAVWDVLDIDACSVPTDLLALRLAEEHYLHALREETVRFLKVNYLEVHATCRAAIAHAVVKPLRAAGSVNVILHHENVIAWRSLEGEREVSTFEPRLKREEGW